MASFLSTLREQSIVEAKTLGLPSGTVDEFNMMSTHPRTVDRVREATEAAAVQPPADPRVARTVYLEEVDGMMFGDDPSQGIVFGRRFVHPDMAFEFTLPPGFRVTNSPERVVAQDGLGAGVLFDIAAVPRGVDMATYVARDWGGEIAVRGVSSFEVNGMQAGSGQSRLQDERQVVRVMLVAIRRDAESAFRLTYLVPDQRAAAMSEEFQATTDSFRRLSAEEAAAVRPLRVQVVEADSGDRVSRLSSNLPYGRFNDEWFRVINDMAPGEEPQPGNKLKVFRS
jgi:predicted Zn-dependent protease